MWIYIYICMSFFGYLLYLDWICHCQWTEHEKNRWIKKKQASGCFWRKLLALKWTLLPLLYRFYVSCYTFFPATECLPHKHACLTFQTAVSHLGYWGTRTWYLWFVPMPRSVCSWQHRSTLPNMDVSSGQFVRVFKKHDLTLNGV